MRAFLLPLLVGLSFSVASCSLSPANHAAYNSTVTFATFKVMKEYPHDTNAYTQGLEVLDDGSLLESTGLLGKSTVSIHKPGETTKPLNLPAEVFGEGITQVGDEYWQVTWKNTTGYRYSKNLQQIGTFSYEGEGWGVCYDAKAGVIYRSDGTDKISLHDDETFSEVNSVKVTTLSGKPLKMLNELECVDDYIWANVWQTPYVVKIDKRTGRTLKVYDLSPLAIRAQEVKGSSLGNDQVLNGLAYDEKKKVWFVTGKQWPILFEGTFE